MQKRKLFALAGVTLLAAGVLAACGGNSKSSSTETKTFSYVYTSDPQTLDYLNSGYATTHEITANLIDGLLENDKYGDYVPSIAEDWKVSKDGLTYTYTIRDGAKWYTSEGEEYADVTAQDFVTGLKHAADKKSDQLYLVQGSIKGLDDYVSGKTTDFSTVGVKAIDDKTIQYTLNSPEPYWNSKTTMGILYPVNADFLASKGDAFGTPTDPSSLLYNGAYYLSAITTKSAIEYTKNPDYWDADNVKIDSIKLTYYNGSDVESLVRGFTDGTYTVGRIFPTAANYDEVKEQYKDNIVYSLQDSTIAFALLNVNRTNYTHTAKTTDAQKQSTNKALQNKDFRQALSFAFDRTSYAAQSNGEEAASKVIRNILTPPTFVSIGEETFGDAVETKLATYGSEWSGVELDDAQDGIHSVEKAKAEFAKAKETLAAQGVEFPIHLDVPVAQSSETHVQRASSMKQAIESALGSENVVVDLHMMDEDTLYAASFYVETAEQNDYDLSITAGWNPDYADPSTYLDIFSAVNGADTHFIGIDPGKTTDVVATVGLDKYQELLDKASAETSDVQKRYELYAEAQAWLTDSALIIPMTSGGGAPSVRRTVPGSGAYAVAGPKGAPGTYKGLEVQEDIVKTADFEKAREEWFKEKAEANAKYQEDLANHVEK